MPEQDHYATLGLDRTATQFQLRNAYRLLAKRHHPDINRNNSKGQIEAINAAYEILRDPARRRAYDWALDRTSQAAAPGRGAKIDHHIRQDVHLRIEEFLRGTSLQVAVKDPALAEGSETYRVEIPALTAPGTCLRLPRQGASGHLALRLKTLPGHRFKVRGSDLRTELRISPQRAAQGGSELIERPTGGMLRLTIPARVKRGEIIRLPGEGMPRPRGGRGDLLIRISYRPEVRVNSKRAQM